MYGHFPSTSLLGIKSDIKVVKRTKHGGKLVSSLCGFDFGLEQAIKNVLDGDWDVDHAIILMYIEDEEDYYGLYGWGMC